MFSILGIKVKLLGSYTTVRPSIVLQSMLLVGYEYVHLHTCTYVLYNSTRTFHLLLIYINSVHIFVCETLHICGVMESGTL